MRDVTAGRKSHESAPSVARSQQHVVDVYGEALRAIIATGTAPTDSMRSIRNQMQERGDAMLSIARAALRDGEARVGD